VAAPLAGALRRAAISGGSRGVVGWRGAAPIAPHFPRPRRAAIVIGSGREDTRGAERIALPRGDLLAALRGSGIDNCFIELDNIEIPILDGSSENFVELIERAGTAQQTAPRRFLKIKERIEFAEDDRKMSVEPSDEYEIECVIDFKHPFINTQNFHFTFSNGSFGREIASARTFGFTREIEMLRKANLARGGSLENAIVLTENGMLNETPLRFQDEFVRHKILDIIGDFALLGMPILGKIRAEKSGHAIHASLMSKLLKKVSAWEIVETN